MAYCLALVKSENEGEQERGGVHVCSESPKSGKSLDVRDAKRKDFEGAQEGGKGGEFGSAKI